MPRRPKPNDDNPERPNPAKPAGFSEPAIPTDSKKPAGISVAADSAVSAAPTGTADPAPSAGKETAAQSSGDAALWGPGSRAEWQPPTTQIAPEAPRTAVVPPRRQLVAYPAGVLPAAGIAGLVAAATVPLDRPGIGWLLAGSATVAAVGVVHRRARRTSSPEQGRARNPERLLWSIAALALLAVGTFRAAEWLFVLCVAAAAATGSLAVIGRRSERGIFREALAVPLAAPGAVAWVYAALGRRPDGAGARNRRLGVSVAVTVALLAVFVPLLAGADATFAALVEGLVPSMRGDTLVAWIVVFGAAGAGTLGALYLLAGPPAAAGEKTTIPNRTLARLEWGLPVGALTVVFALFLGAQLVALFGGDDYVQRTAGLTYAEYARGGFWQLSAVTVLTLAVILPVLHRATRETATDRLWLRGLLCAISALTLVMIASALGRMWTYQQAYGFTVLRLLVGTCELWLGVVYVLVIVAVLRLETTWLPRTAVATAVAALLVLAAINPEGLVAGENIDRWQRGENLDVDYLAGLSADIVPAIDRLPVPLRIDLYNRLEHQLDDDTWNSWNLARSRAR
ncbi:DUF4153 domain-containing protein [Nocardia sp. CA-290969]|uniref:DUF4153 domain-containing protein n=1 Tax=Nocardia sp. CA-290969 TaxID=3239986 RepID=UPI003D8DFA4F